MIQHRLGFTSWYAHLASITSWVGEQVTGGTPIGYVGSTGASTGPHLHYEIWRGGRRINPAGVRTQEGTVLAGSDLAAFRAEKARIDRIIAAGGERRAQAPTLSNGLRPAQG